MPTLALTSQSNFNGRSIKNFAFIAAAAAAKASQLRGCQNPARLDLVATEALWSGFERYAGKVSLKTHLCKHHRNYPPYLPEGTLIGKPGGLSPELLIAEPVENVEGLAEWTPQVPDLRGSLTAYTLTPSKAVRSFHSPARAKKLGLPPGSPVGNGPGRIGIDTPPAEIVWTLCKHFELPPRDVHIWILSGARRFWNKRDIEEFKVTNATVHEIDEGDLEAHILAVSPRGSDGALHVSYGIGGITESLIAAPFAQMNGGHLLLKVDPLGEHRDEIIKAGCASSLGRVFDADHLCEAKNGPAVSFVAGITDTTIVPGVTTDPSGKFQVVTVLVGSPMFDAVRVYKCHVETRAAVVRVA